MENASRALLIAGGVLIAVLTIALLVRSFTSISIFQKAQLSEEEQAQLIAFNEQYTKYLGQYVYGTEVITVINKSFNNKSHHVTTKIKFISLEEGYTYKGYTYNEVTKRYDKSVISIKKGNTLTIENDAENISVVKEAINHLNSSEDLKTMAFKCTDIGYDLDGRVNSIKFEEKQWGDLWNE